MLNVILHIQHSGTQDRALETEARNSDAGPPWAAAGRVRGASQAAAGAARRSRAWARGVRAGHCYWPAGRVGACGSSCTALPVGPPAGPEP